MSDNGATTEQGQSVSTSAKQIDARWEDVAEAALKRAGFDVINRAGTCDYQGWGVLMGKAGDEFAVVSWSYGSCGMCDNFEDERGMTEQEARLKFDSSKGW